MMIIDMTTTGVGFIVHFDLNGNNVDQDCTTTSVRHGFTPSGEVDCHR